MAIWQPSQAVGVKVLGLVWSGHRLLAAEVEDSLGHVTGVRPLGGSIKFGETREAALAREFREELGCTVDIVGPWHSIENIFEHEGRVGHEYVFAANLRLGDPQFQAREEIAFRESDGSLCVARWFSPLAMPEGVGLFPSGLADLVVRGTVTP